MEGENELVKTGGESEGNEEGLPDEEKQIPAGALASAEGERGTSQDRPEQVIAQSAENSALNDSGQASESNDSEPGQGLEEAETKETAGDAGGLSWLKRYRVSVIIVTVLVLLFTAVTGALGIYTRDNGLITDGIIIANINVSNMSIKEAKVKLDAKIKALIKRSLKIHVGSEEVTIPLQQLGFVLTADKALGQAYQVGRTGSVFYKAYEKAWPRKVIRYELTESWDDKKLKDTLNEYLRRFNKPTEDAGFIITDDNRMEIKKEVPGSMIDIPALGRAITQQDVLQNNVITARMIPDKSPKITAAQLENQKVTGLIASYTTYFDPNLAGRTVNIRLAAKALDKVVIKPGKTFSFNNTVGPRTVEKGYQEAIIIENGAFVPGLGGGVCQVSSTLYNVVLMANLKVTERTKHSLPVTYVPPGKDATVAYPDIDLKFVNNSGGYLFIRTKVASSSLTIDMYGKSQR